MAAQSGAALPRQVVLLVGAAAAVLAVAGVRAAASLLASVLLALVLTVAVLPVGRWALRRGWPNWIATGLTLVAAFAVLLFLIGGLALSVTQLAASLPAYAPRVTALTTEILDRLQRFGVNTDSATTALKQINISTVVSTLTTVLSSVLNILGSLLFLAVLLFFMIADALAVARRGPQLWADQPAVARVLADFARGTQRYLVVSALFGAIVAVLDVGALWLLAVPLPLTWGLLSFLTNFIPNVGFVLGVVPPALLALLDQGWVTMVWVLVAYSVLNVVIQTFIQPRYVGDSVGLNATTTFLSLAFWSFVLGPLGALLAIPATLLVRAVFIDPYPSSRWVMLLFGTAGPPEPAAEPA
jgi:predicted PurR-regulated permease PerM